VEATPLYEEKPMVEIIEKMPPQAIEAEMAVLGSMLIEEEVVEKVINLLSEKSFYKEAHQQIYRALCQLYEKNRAVDLVTLTEELKREKILSDIGGVAYLNSLINSVTTTANVEDYAAIVREKVILRELIKVSTNIIAECYREPEDAKLLLDRAEQQIFSIAQRRKTQQLIEIKTYLHSVLDKAESLYQGKGLITGIPTGYVKFDTLTAGLHPSNLIIIAARPSMGKTSLCLNIAENIALKEKIPVAIFSLEMSVEEILLRLLCSNASVNISDLRRGYTAVKKTFRALTDAASRLSEAPIYLSESPNFTVDDIRTEARRLVAEKGQILLIIDYLQLLAGFSSRYESRQQEISDISRSLKNLSRDLKIPVIAVSQLSRRPEEKERAGRPRLSDLRESGALEQDADVVAFIYQEQVNKPEDKELEGRVKKILVAKQRNGPTGEFELTFLKEYTRFENLIET